MARKLSPRNRAGTGKTRPVAISARITRKPTTAGQYSRPYAFEVCIRMKNAGACGYGRNPRKALANAMQQVAKNLRKRKGAYASL